MTEWKPAPTSLDGLGIPGLTDAEIERFNDALIEANRDVWRERAEAAEAARDAARGIATELEAENAQLQAENETLRENAAIAEQLSYWEFGHLTEHGWVPEPRGEKYALHRRLVRCGPAEWIYNGEPAAAGGVL